MDVGLSVASSVAGAAPGELVASILQRVDAASAAGLDALHVGDKHGTSEPYAANIALAARLSAEWPGTLGVLVVSSMWNPVLLAEQLATLADAAGHLVVVAALGDGPSHFASVGLPIEQRRSLFVDGLAITRALLAGETVSTTIGPYTIQDAQVPLGPQVDVSWWIAASAPSAIDRAASLGDGWLASAKLTPEQAVEALDRYRTAGGTGRAAIRREVFVGRTSSEVAATMDPIMRAGHRGYPPEALVGGTTDDVVGALAALGEAGFDEVLVRSLAPEQPMALSSIERLADVRRHLRR